MTYQEAKGRILTPVNAAGMPISSGWIVSGFTTMTDMVILISVQTGDSHVEKWSRVRRWLKTGAVVVAPLHATVGCC